MSIAGDLHRIARQLKRLVDYLTHPHQHVRVHLSFTTPENTMSDTVTLTAGPSGVQNCTVTAATTQGGVNVPATFSFSSSDESVATVIGTSNNGGTVTAVADPAGDSTRTCNITARTLIGGVEYTKSGVATVVTQAGAVVLTLDFGTPTP